MLELTTVPEHYQATLEGRRKHHVLIRTVGAPLVGDTARVTYVETLSGGPLGPMHVLSLDVRMSVERMPALAGIPTPVPTG